MVIIMHDNKVRLYLIRHGESETNNTHCHGGWGEYRLTERGKQQATAVGMLLQQIRFDCIYTSALLRAIQTKHTALPRTPETHLPFLNEINVGNLTGKAVADCEADFGENYINHRRAMDFTPWEGENYRTFCDRIRLFFNTIAENAGADFIHTVAAFTHGGVMHAVLDMLIGGELSDQTLPSPTENRIDKSAFHCPNCTIVIYEFSNGKWHLASWNTAGCAGISENTKICIST